MDSDTCTRFESEAAAFVLGDIPAEERADMIAHLDFCGSCRREVSTLAAALDSISGAVGPMDPSEGFVERVLAAAELVLGPAASTPTTAEEVATAPISRPVAHVVGRTHRLIHGGSAGDKGRPMTLAVPGEYARQGDDLRSPDLRSRPVTVVVRRRRTFAALTGATVVLALLAMAFHTWALMGPAIAVGVLDVAYVSLVLSVTHLRAKAEITTAFDVRLVPDDDYWRQLEREVLPAVDGNEAEASAVVAVHNTALAHFAFSYFLGWALTPVVGLIRLLRGDLSGIEQSPLLHRIVALQQRGRAQSLKLLVAGATTVAVAGGGASMLIAPSMASAQTSAPSYTVHPGDTLSGIAARFGTSTSALAQLNGISDPSFILPGEVIKLSGSAAASVTADTSTSTYTVVAGDTLDSIAARFATTEEEMASLNHLSDPNLIYVGQVLNLSGSAAAAPSPASTASSSSSPSSDPVAGNQAAGVQKVLAYARAQLGKPYEWGGAGPNSFDCSGLVMMAWSQAGVSFPHLAQDQYDMTQRVTTADLIPGDLVFYGSPTDVYHDGIYIGNGEMIAAPETGQNVQIQSIYFDGLLGGGRVAS